jgi:uncharacterized protein YcfL
MKNLLRASRTARSTALAALALSALLGCRSSGGPLNSYVVTEGRHEVVIDLSNRALGKRLSVEDVVSERRDGLLFVQAKLQNRSGRAQHFEWMVEWYDRGNLLVGKPTAWESLRLGGGEPETIRQSAPDGSAVSMRLSVRPQDQVR